MLRENWNLQWESALLGQSFPLWWLVCCTEPVLVWEWSREEKRDGIGFEDRCEMRI